MRRSCDPTLGLSVICRICVHLRESVAQTLHSLGAGVFPDSSELWHKCKSAQPLVATLAGANWRVLRNDRVGDITGGIGSESPDGSLDGVLKDAKSVGYSFCVNLHGVEIERASSVQTSLEQKDTKATKNANQNSSRHSRRQRRIRSTSTETIPSFGHHACPLCALISKTTQTILFVSFVTFCFRTRPTPCARYSPERQPRSQRRIGEN